jgi:hypothetical protein
MLMHPDKHVFHLKSVFVDILGLNRNPAQVVSLKWLQLKQQFEPFVMPFWRHEVVDSRKK